MKVAGAMQCNHADGIDDETTSVSATVMYESIMGPIL